jgi:hypothetical protein
MLNQSSVVTSLISQAVSLARDYNWPAEAAYMQRTGWVPEGFPREVGSAIALFMNPPPLGGLLHSSREEYARERENDRAHGHQLAKLRVLLAKIGNHERKRSKTSSDGSA